MSTLSALQIYLMTLSVIQPARIQDVEANVPSLFGENVIEEVGLDTIRRVHKYARESKLVFAVRRGSYFVSRRGASIVRHGKISSQIDNRRLFLMKKQRRKFS